MCNRSRRLAEEMEKNYVVSDDWKIATPALLLLEGAMGGVTRNVVRSKRN